MVPVAVKTCKVESEESMGEKFLEEACEYFNKISFCVYIWITVMCNHKTIKIQNKTFLFFNQVF